MGSTSHSFIIEKLKPDTAYEVKLRAFNLAGMSPVSTVTRQSTDPSQTSSANMNDTKANFFNGSDREAENKNEPLVETEVKMEISSPRKNDCHSFYKLVPSRFSSTSLLGVP